MPKDPTKNIFQYKIRGGHLNEFEFHQNQGQVKGQHDRPWERENFDPNAVLPGPEEPGSPKAQAKRLPSGATVVKQTAKTSSKASKKAAKKQAAKRPAAPGTKQAGKKSSKSAVKTPSSKKAAKAVSTGRAKKAFKKRKLRAGVR